MFFTLAVTVSSASFTPLVVTSNLTPDEKRSLLFDGKVFHENLSYKIACWPYIIDCILRPKEKKEKR